ncbi:hypothetical protein ABFS82_08G065200 [Erythranthe guttata]
MRSRLTEDTGKQGKMEKNQEVVLGVRKGAWTKDEDILLRKCIENYGEGKWHLVPLRAGVNRCRKSCRLRWLNYLRPNLKRGIFNQDEIDLIVRLHNLLGNRWSLIAGRIPGRTANDIKNFWKTHFRKKSSGAGESSGAVKTPALQGCNIFRPTPRTLSKSFQHVPEHCPSDDGPSDSSMFKNKEPFLSPVVEEGGEDDGDDEEGDDEKIDECIKWWAELLETTENGQGNNSSLFSDDHLMINEPSSAAKLTPNGLFDHANIFATHIDNGLTDLSLDFDDWEL